MLLHTNLGRAPLSAAAIDALGALADAVPTAAGVHVVNNGAAALVLAATALAAGRGPAV